MRGAGRGQEAWALPGRRGTEPDAGAFIVCSPVTPLAYERWSGL